jgi:hypothetical protein
MILFLGAFVALSVLLGPTPARLLCQMTGQERPAALACCHPPAPASDTLDAPGCCSLRPGEDRASPAATLNFTPEVLALTACKLVVPRPALVPVALSQTALLSPRWRGPPPGSASARAPPYFS